MARRAVLGKRIRINNEDLRGVFISGLDTSSGAGTDASPYAAADVLGTNASGQLEPTTFDSGAHVGGGYQVYSYHQGTLTTTSTNDTVSTTVTHNWGRDTYGVGNTGTQRPLFAFRWTPTSEIVNGLATTAYPPIGFTDVYELTGDPGDEEEEQSESEEQFLTIEATHDNSNQIEITLEAHSSEGGSGLVGIGWALLVFYEDDFNGGKSI